LPDALALFFSAQQEPVASQTVPIPIVAMTASLRAAVEWRLEKFRAVVRRHFVRKGGEAYIRCRWPWPLNKPWQHRRLRLFSFGGGIGDELMCTPIFREIRRLNPGCHLIFVSRYPEMFQGNPSLNAVEFFPTSSFKNAICLRYQTVLPPPRPLITLLAECVGLSMASNRLDPPVVAPTPDLRARIAAIPGPRIVVQPQASHWTPNKQWPIESWRELLKLLLERFEVIEVGKQSLFNDLDLGLRFHKLAGETSMADFAWVVSQASVFIGPLSGGMHLANAFQVPMVVIIGGYEGPEGYKYPWVECFYSPVHCAPCWLTTPCPHELKCLRAIKPEQVFNAVMKAIAPVPERSLAG
jgi:ADP-heptose:LPS heptosyltransferase